MGFHTFPVERADVLEDPSRYRHCSREELLGMLAVDGDATVADFGSGTGFYTRDVAAFVDTLVAVDIQQEMHEKHREYGVSAGTLLLVANLSSLPFRDGELDAAFSTMTHHEYAKTGALEEVARVIRPDGRLVTVDWSATGLGDSGPPTDERFAPSGVTSQLESAGFTVESTRDRPETLAVVARR